MLEGLEATEVRYSQLNKERRFDAEYFSKINIILYEQLRSISTTTIGEIAIVTDGIHTSIDYSEESDINLISATSPRENFFDLSRQVFISSEAHAKNPRTELLIDDVIVSTVGTIGNCAVVRPCVLPANSDRHVGIIRLRHKEYSPYFLSTFLLTKYGRMQTLRESTGNVQLNLFLYKIRDLLIPKLSLNAQKGIEMVVVQANEKLEISSSLYSSAENYLLECLGMQDFVANPDAYNIKTLKESFLESGRIDAEYYLPKYDDLTLFVQNYSLGSLPLSDIVDFYRGSLISDTYYIDYDVARPAYIRGGDISSNRMVADNMVSISSDFIPSEETICIEGDIVMAMIGSVGTASIVTQDFSGSYISNNLGLLRICNHSIRAEVLHLYLTSPIGRMFFTQRQMVTAQPKIAFRDIENIPIPLIRPEVQAEIAQHIQRSFALRKEASQLLEEAKLSVERAIRAGDMGGGNYLIYRYLQNKARQEERLATHLLLKELGLIAEKPQRNKVVATEKKLSTSFFTSGRLDAEYYQPKYDYLDSQLSLLPTQRLGELVEMRKSIEPGSEAYQTEGIPFVRVADLNKFGIEMPSVCLDRAIYATAPRPQKDTILLSKDGSVGIAYKVEDDMDMITSGAILHLSVKGKGILPDYLTLVLNSRIVKMQAERDAGGSIIQHWKPSEIEQVVIPILPPDIQQKLSEQVSKSFALRREAKSLLEQAKLMVEQTIENLVPLIFSKSYLE